jgi:hypothetical protein
VSAKIGMHPMRAIARRCARRLARGIGTLLLRRAVPARGKRTVAR